MNLFLEVIADELRTVLRPYDQFAVRISTERFGLDKDIRVKMYTGSGDLSKCEPLSPTLMELIEWCTHIIITINPESCTIHSDYPNENTARPSLELYYYQPDFMEQLTNYVLWYVTETLKSKQ